MRFETNPQFIAGLLDTIHIEEYGRSRNFLDGHVTRLSPYISRGMISVKSIAERLKTFNLPHSIIAPFVMQMAWREYFYYVWEQKGTKIEHDIKRQQLDCKHYNQIPTALISGKTGIQVVDKAIAELIATGYIHNHNRLYIASIFCNLAKCHWLSGAKWMYSHLLDGDLASNHLSWQWVAGTFSNKKYFANQENINYYSKSIQKNTFLDVNYDYFSTSFEVPEILSDTSPFEALNLNFPNSDILNLNELDHIYLYHYYNLDPNFCKNKTAKNILLLDPDFFSKYPIQQSVFSFFLDLAKQNIPSIKIYVGNIAKLMKEYNLRPNQFHYKSHPTLKIEGAKEYKREVLFPNISGEFNSFFSFWKQCEKIFKNW